MSNTILINKTATERSLLALRLGVFIVMALWGLDKLLYPDHAARIFANFYGMNIGHSVSYALGAAQMLLLTAFLIGYKRTFTYGTVLALHAGSTLASFGKYMDPFNNLLFFAAWPMLAACFALFLLREHDNLLAVNDDPALSVTTK